MHKLLQRQLRQSREDGAAAELNLAALIELVDKAYHEVDRERRIMAHAYQVMRDEQAALSARQMKAQETMAEMRAATAEAERARAVAEAQILKQERLSVLGQLTATVAHELRNPLSTIRNSLHVLREIAASTGTNLERPLNRMQRSIERCNGIIADLLDYARARELVRTVVPLDAWLNDVLDEQHLPPEIVLRRELTAPGLSVEIDADRFRRVIINLVENAAQAIMEAEVGATGRTITVGTAKGDVAEIVVEDSGPGIPPGILPRIFEPLFSTKSFGTGLGLPTVKQIVEQHEGAVSIISESGQGTKVKIRLPLALTAPAPELVAELAG
jgi:signal transduction histidine kinase